MTDTRAGFHFAGMLNGGVPVRQTHTFKDTETLTKGDMVNAESGEIDLAATGDTALLGVVTETKAGTDSTTTIEVIVSPEALYSVYDANARNVGDTLDITGVTGAQTVTTSSNAEFIVVANSTASERTVVRINPSSHALV